MLPADWPLGHLPRVTLDATQVARIQHGQAVLIAFEASESPGLPGAFDVSGGPDTLRAGVAAARVRLYDATGRFLGIGEADGTGTVKPRRLFNAES